MGRSHTSYFSSLESVSAPQQLISLKAANIIAGKYVYCNDLLKLEEHRDPSCPVQWPVCPSPIRLANWSEFLQTHPDKQFAAYIHSGLLNGFHIGFDRRGPSLKSARRNHPSASANVGVVTDYIAAEVEAGRLLGPLQCALLPFIKISPIGLVPKNHQVG